MKKVPHQSIDTQELLSGDEFLSQDSPWGGGCVASRVLRNVTEQELFEAGGSL